MSTEICTDDKAILDQNAKKFEVFWLRPKKMNGSEAVLRMQLVKKWGGWKLKDELVRSIGLEVGDTMNTEVKVLGGSGLIDADESVDLFASGKGADWLLDNDVSCGSVIDAMVRFVYSKAPVGGNSKEIWTISLIFLEGCNIVEKKSEEEPGQHAQKPLLDDLMKLLNN